MTVLGLRRTITNITNAKVATATHKTICKFRPPDDTFVEVISIGIECKPASATSSET